jgi:hypothetical protein
VAHVVQTVDSFKFLVLLCLNCVQPVVVLTEINVDLVDDDVVQIFHQILFFLIIITSINRSKVTIKS